MAIYFSRPLLFKISYTCIRFSSAALDLLLNISFLSSFSTISISPKSFGISQNASFKSSEMLSLSSISAIATKSLSFIFALSISL